MFFTIINKFLTTAFWSACRTQLNYFFLWKMIMLPSTAASFRFKDLWWPKNSEYWKHVSVICIIYCLDSVAVSFAKYKKQPKFYRYITVDFENLCLTFKSCISTFLVLQQKLFTSMKTVFFFTQATSNQEEYIYAHISPVPTEATVTAIETENKRIRLKL